MGVYVTEADILGLMPQLPTAGEGYTATSALIALAIDIAESEINGIVAQRYDLPFSAVPLQVRAIAKELGVYHTYAKLYSGDNVNRNAYAQAFIDDPNNAYMRLDKIGNGIMKLTLTDGSLLVQASSTSRAMSGNMNYATIFDMDTVTSWRLDPDRKADIADGR